MSKVPVTCGSRVCVSVWGFSLQDQVTGGVGGVHLGWGRQEGTARVCFLLFCLMKWRLIKLTQQSESCWSSVQTHASCSLSVLLLFALPALTFWPCLVKKKKKTVRYSILFCSILFVDVCVSVWCVSLLLTPGSSTALSRAGRSLEYSHKYPLSNLFASVL